MSLTENPSRIVLRRATVHFVTAAFEPFHFGLVKEVKLKAITIPAGRDSHGRTQVAGYDCSIEFSIMQTHANDLAALSAIIEPGTLQLRSGSHSLGLPNVKPRFEYDLDAAGGISAVKCMADVILEKHQLIDIILAAGQYGSGSGNS